MQAEPSAERAASEVPLAEPFQPDWTLPPGVILARVLAERGITEVELAAVAKLGPEIFHGVIKGTAPIDGFIAGLLAAALGTSASLWVDAEAIYRADLERGAQPVRLGEAPVREDGRA